jgi:hypothetical protein
MQLHMVIRAIVVAMLCGVGLAHADYCREYPLEELETMSLATLEAERERVTDLMLQGFLVDGVEISDQDHAGCEAQGRILDSLILAHKFEASARAKKAELSEGEAAE